MLSVNESTAEIIWIERLEQASGIDGIKVRYVRRDFDRDLTLVVSAGGSLVTYKFYFDMDLPRSYIQKVSLEFILENKELLEVKKPIEDMSMAEVAALSPDEMAEAYKAHELKQESQ